MTGWLYGDLRPSGLWAGEHRGHLALATIRFAWQLVASATNALATGGGSDCDEAGVDGPDSDMEADGDPLANTFGLDDEYDIAKFASDS